MKRSSIFAAALAGVIALLGACDGGTSGPGSVASVVVAAPADSVAQGASVQLSITLRDLTGAELTGRVVEWTSYIPAVARVEGAGVVTGAAAGSATITATSEGQSGTVAIRVVPVPVARDSVRSVDLGVARLSLYAGQVVQLSATARDSAGRPITGGSVLWASDASTIASVRQTGLVAVGPTGQGGGSGSVGAVLGVVGRGL